MQYFIVFFIGLISCFQYGVDKIRGVNIGGWLVLEPWITPSLFRQFEGKRNPANDEWMFCEILGKSQAERQLRGHWDSWFTEGDLGKLAASGINHIRIPIGYWAFDSKPTEPWVTGAFQYLEKAIGWARNHGILVMIDIHGAPGSQNGFDNSGRRDHVKMFENPDNIQRMHKIFAFLSHKFARETTVSAIQLVNEPAGWALDGGLLKQFYSDGYDQVRRNNSQVVVTVHDAFKPLKEWEYLRKHHHVMLDTHIYQVFDYNLVNLPKSTHLELPCRHRNELGTSNSKLWTIVGEWSLATTDCTRWLNGFNKGARYDGTLDGGKGPACPGCTCGDKDNLATYTAEHRDFLKKFAMQQIGVYESHASGWFFWNFKAENSPEWNFLMGVEQGWINLHEPIQATC